LRARADGGGEDMAIVLVRKADGPGKSFIPGYERVRDGSAISRRVR
jgi:hypothetical protein